MEEEHDKFWKRIAEDLRRHMDGNGRGTSYNSELQILESVRPWITAGKVKVTSGNQKYFDLLESRYPIGLHRIDWRGVKPHESYDILPSQDRHTVRARDELVLLTNARSIIDSLLSKDTASAADLLVWTGDSCDLTLEASPRVFLECYPHLFGSGQHSYVIPPGGEWCINYTMEGQLFWGYSSDSIVTGCVDLDSVSSE